MGVNFNSFIISVLGIKKFISLIFLSLISILLDLFKKNKDILFINLAFFIFEHYFKRFSERGSFNKNKIYEIKNEIFDILNNFKLYNINHTALLNAVSSKLNYE